MENYKEKYEIDCFPAGCKECRYEGKCQNHKVMMNSICFKGMSSLQVQDWAKPDQAMPRCMTYMLQKPSKHELDWIQKLDVDGTSEWFNSFVLALMSNGKVRLCLDHARLNQALIRPVHRGPMMSDIFPKLTCAHYLTITDATPQQTTWN